MTFNAITKSAVQEALEHPREIDHSLVDAQQARRLLDRIVGYKISPILTRRVQGSKVGGLSAGRVQSVALKFVVDREKEIDAFVPVEYWNIGSFLKTEVKGSPFEAHLYSIGGKRLEKEPIPGKECFTVPDQTTAEGIVSKLKKAKYTVGSVEKKEKKRNPVAPFITSTLQQEASRYYGFSASRTMQIAQGLYEGVDLGSEGAEGLITYMRTDSVRLAPESIAAARDYIAKEYGKEFLPEEGRQYATKKTAQDAHEAIRPTNVGYHPESIKKYLNPDQHKLYVLIWRRFIATQMNPAIYDTVSCDIVTDQDITLHATGSVIKFKGFLIAYEEKQDYAHTSDSDRILPPLKEGQPLFLENVSSAQAFTRPPPRYTEASLVKELEKSGVGRPSTYVAIMNKIQSRDYTVKEKGVLRPTELGKVIAAMLEANFKLIMDVGFTATMEDELERVAENQKNWKVLLKEFWDVFIPTVETAEKEAFVPKEMTTLDCPKCGHKLQKIWSRRKYFYGCSNYPTCDYTTAIEALDFKKEDYDPSFDWDQKCSKCSGPMQLRFGRFGPFLGCLKYPECKGIVNIPKKGDPLAKDLPSCPAKGCDGKMTQRRSRFGKVFFSCTNYPDCDVIVNDLDDLSEKYPDHPKTAYVARPKGKKGAGRQRVYGLSEELQAVVESKELSRPEITKALWVYIKKHKLQDPKNKRQIIPDAKLAKVFGSKAPLDMFQLASVIGKHLK